MKLFNYRFIFALLFAGVAISPHAAAQVTIHAQDVTSQIGQSNSVASYTSNDADALQTIVDATGENRTYDFSAAGISNTLQGDVTYHGDPDGLPAAEDYPSSNHIMALQLGVGAANEDSTIWIYNRIESDAAYTLGGAFLYEDPDTGDEDTLSFEYDPPRLNFPLPVTYGDAWTDTTDFFGIEAATESEVEGWGTLVTPGGSFDALRVRVTTTTNSFGFESTSHQIDFITKSLDAGATISLDSDGRTAVTAEISVWAVDTAADSDELPQHVRLRQNFPNPFNPATTFAYELDASRHVRLTVHDMLGRTVAVLVDGRRPAGNHEVSFDASGLPSGTYLYRLQATGGTETRAMILAK